MILHAYRKLTDELTYMTLTHAEFSKIAAVVKSELQPEFDRLDENARRYRDEILTAVDAYKVLVETYKAELASLQAKYSRLETVLKRVVERVGVDADEL